jgi:crossover junction endodeoxyribonuclease RuvC
VIEVDGKNTASLVSAGVIATPVGTLAEDRLLDIYESLREIIDETGPDEVVIEKLFFSQNITTAIPVAQARGVAMLVARQAGLPIFEYTPLQIKQTLTSYGRADKKQMQEMVKVHLGLKQAPRQDDAADALAAAITHSLMRRGG